jgi:hypothetical protein
MLVEHSHQWNTVTSSMLGIVLTVATCVLSRIIETGEREAEHYELKYSVKNTVLLLERRKPNQRTNTVILTNVTTVISAKHSDSDTEQDYAICTFSVRLRHHKLPCTA